MNWLVPAAWAGVMAAGGVMAWAVRAPQSTLLAPSVWHGPRNRKAVALTFDDGPSESTPEVLSLLAEHQAKATFFVIGTNVERLPDIARRIATAGHEIGNHTYTHSPLYLRHAQFIADELGLCQQAVWNAAGVAPDYFRAPYGCRWFGLRAAQQAYQLQGAMWSAIALDWKLPGTAIARRLKKAARNGAILCLHDGRERRQQPDIRSTLEATRLLLPQLQAEGYDLVTISDLLCPKQHSNA